MPVKHLIFCLTRQLIYLIILILSVLVCWKIGHTFKAATVQEYGFFESAQSLVLLLIALSFGAQACRNRECLPIFYCLSSLALAALVREHDAYMDQLLPIIGWSWCWIFPISGLFLLIRKRKTIGPALQAFLRSTSFHMMVAALITIIPIAQCLGHRSFLVDLLGDNQVDASLVRRILEEPIELIGYIQILLASIESIFEFHRKQNPHRQMIAGADAITGR